MTADKQRKKSILITLAIFLSLFLFYKWQLATSDYYLNKGNEAYDAKNFNEALKNYKYAATIDGDRDAAYEAKIKRAEIFYRHWQLDEAEKNLNEAAAEKSNNYRVYELLGDVYSAKKQFGQSADNYNRALELNNSRQINLKLAKCFIAGQKTDLAIKTLLNSQTENLKNDDAQNDDAAIPYYLGLLGLYKNASFNDNFKSIENNDGYKEKILKIKEVLEIYDEQKNSDYNNVIIADLYNKIDEPYFSLNKTGEVTKNNPNYRDAWIVSGKSNFIIGSYKKSLEDFNKALALDGNNPEIHFWIANVYEKMGIGLKAEEFFNKYEELK